MPDILPAPLYAQLCLFQIFRRMQAEDFANASPAFHRAAIAPAILGYFHRISAHPPNLCALVTYWPSQVHVADVPLTKNPVSSFGMFAPLMRSSIPRPDIELLETDYPEYPWLTVKDMIAQIRQFIAKESDDKVGELVESIANHIQITAIRETFERLAGESQKVLMQIIEVEWIRPRNYAFNDTIWWVTVWSAMYAAWATKNGHNPPWYPEFTSNKPVHQATSDHSLRATVSVTKLALKPGVSTPTLCRFTTDDDDDQSSNNRNRSPSRTSSAKKPAPN